MPSICSDQEAEQFIDTADLSEYDLSGFKPMRFDIEKKIRNRFSEKTREQAMKGHDVNRA